MMAPAVRPADPLSKARVDLTVVFVTRNEEEGIEACVRTTMEAVDEARIVGVLRSAEYVLVDSASTDRTVEIASRFPLLIVRLEPDWPLSCGAGCHVGLLHARGTFTAIVNGDMTIDRGWFRDVLPVMAPDVAAACGVAKEDLVGRTTIERLVTRFSSMPLSYGELAGDVANHSGGYSAGTLLLRTDAARAVGSYNPFFRAAEDMDLRHRLLRAGWTVLDVPVLQGEHRWADGAEPLDIAQYFRTIVRNSVGLGQMARYNWRRDPAIARRALSLIFNGRLFITIATSLVLVGLGAAHGATLASGLLWPLAFPVIADALFLRLLTRRARQLSLRFSDHFFSIAWYASMFVAVRLAGSLRGFLMRPFGPGDYPLRARTAPPL